MDVLPRRQPELGDKIDLRPADDLAEVAVDDGAQEFAGPVIEQPDAVGREARLMDTAPVQMM